MIREVFEEIQKPEAIFCSVGGGGLLGGIIEGCAKVGWDDGKLITLMKEGLNSKMGCSPHLCLRNAWFCMFLSFHVS